MTKKFVIFAVVVLVRAFRFRARLVLYSLIVYFHLFGSRLLSSVSETSPSHILILILRDTNIDAPSFFL